MKKLLAAALTLPLLALAACSGAPQPAATPGGDAPAPRTLTVFAAASLKGAFSKMAQDFSTDNPGTTVRFSFEGSSTLVDQLAGGAPADVFASADEKNMSRALDAKLVAGEPKIFATNTLILVVAPGNPLGITGLDASLDGKKLVVCAVGVPCGNATDKIVKATGATIKPVSTEQKVTDVLGKVTSGEADAGVVYTTDASSAGDKVATVEITGAADAVNRYPIAVTATAKDAALATAFVNHVTGDQGQKVLAEFGFGRP